jgi:hypothetical protein
MLNQDGSSTGSIQNADLPAEDIRIRKWLLYNIFNILIF